MSLFERIAAGTLRDVPVFGLSGEIADLSSARSELIRHSEVPCSQLITERVVLDVESLHALVDKLSLRESEWSFFSAWTQVVDFYYDVNTTFGIAELHARESPRRTIRTHVSTTLDGLKIEHDELVDCMHAADCVRGTVGEDLQQKAPWATKLDAATFISSAMVSGAGSPCADLQPLLAWMEKTQTTHSPQWHAWKEQDGDPRSWSVLVRSRPVISSALPNTVRLRSCSVRFEKSLISKCRTFKVVFVTEGYGSSYSEAEQQLWSSPSYFVRIVSDGFSPQFSPLFAQLAHPACSASRSSSSHSPWLSDFSRDVTAVLHTWSYYERGPSHPLPPPPAPLPLLLSHAQEYMAGRYVSDASDIFTHWGPMYSYTHEGYDEGSSLTKPINTSGSMPRFYRLRNPTQPFVLRPKLMHCSPALCRSGFAQHSRDSLAEGSAHSCCQFFEESGCADLGLDHFNLLRLECGFSKA
jgi:hypothetical protein